MNVLHHDFAKRKEVFTRANVDQDELTDLPPKLLGPYRMWLAGDDLTRKYKKSAFYKHRKALLPFGVDIAVRRWRPAADASLMGPGLLALTVAAAAVVVWRAPQYHAMVGCLAQLVVVALFGWRSRPFGVWRMAR